MSAAPGRKSAAGLRLAYLCTRYPALSHTFIQREIEALQGLGVEVVPFSIRRPTLLELGRGADDGEISRTAYVFSHPLRVVLVFIRSLFLSPIKVLRLLARAQALAPGGLMASVRHLAYCMQAVELVRQLRRRELTRIHVHMANNAAMVALLASVFDPRTSYSMTVHGSAEFFDVYRLALRQKAECAEFVRFISDCGRAQLMAFTDPSLWARFHVVHCGIKLTPLTKRDLNPEEKLKLLTIGRLSAEKGQPILFCALRMLTESGIPWSLRVVGDGPDRGALETLADRLGISDGVQFVGPLSPRGVREELLLADLLVLASFAEGIPIVLMEAMAAGLPVVATCVGGIPELIVDGVTGRLVTPGSEEMLASALAEVWTNPAAAREMTSAARVKVEGHFDVERTAEQMRSLFEKYAPSDRSQDATSVERRGPPIAP